MRDRSRSYLAVNRLRDQLRHGHLFESDQVSAQDLHRVLALADVWLREDEAREAHLMRLGLSDE